MATKVCTPTLQQSEKVVQFKWATLNNGDDGAPVEWAIFADRSVQVTGNFGAGGNVRIEGSNDGGVTWAPLSGPTGAALDITAAGIKQIVECVGLIRPRVTAGDGTTALVVSIIGRKVI